MKQRTFQISMFIMLMFGAFDMMRSVAAPLMQRDWHLSYMQLGVAFGASSLAYLLGSLVGGFVVDRAGLKASTLSGGLGIVLGIWCIVWIQSYVGLIIGFALMGLATGFMEIGTNAVIPAMADADENQAKYFNWLHGAYGVGGFIFPIIAGSLIRITHSWRNVYVDLSIIFLAGLAITMFTNYRQKPAQPRDSGSGRLGDLLREPVLYGLLVGIGTYAMVEVGLANWLPLYLVEQRHVSVLTSSVYLSGFYFTYTVGRMTAHYWVDRVGNYRAIVMSAVFSIVAIAIGMVGSGLALCAFIVAGFGFAVIFPTIAAVAANTFPAHSGKVLGFLFAASGTGTLLVNAVIGFVSTRCGLATGFASILAFMFISILSVLFAAAANRRRRKSPEMVTFTV